MSTTTGNRADAGWTAAAEALAVGAGLAVFALFVHSRGAALGVALAGMAAAAAILAVAVARAPSPTALFGFAPADRRTALYAPVGAAVGVGAAVAYRAHCGWSLVPETFASFALVAALVGGAEEIVYRGYVQGRVRRLGIVGAVILAAALHTAYKSALFAIPPDGAATDVAFVATWTLLGGLVFGALRALCGNVWPALAAHVAFDLAAYAEQASPPWWVWS